MFLCSLIEELCTKEENGKTGTLILDTSVECVVIEKVSETRYMDL